MLSNFLLTAILPTVACGLGLSFRGDTTMASADVEVLHSIQSGENLAEVKRWLQEGNNVNAILDTETGGTAAHLCATRMRDLMGDTNLAFVFSPKVKVSAGYYSAVLDYILALPNWERTTEDNAGNTLGMLFEPVRERMQAYVDNVKKVDETFEKDFWAGRTNLAGSLVHFWPIQEKVRKAYSA